MSKGAKSYRFNSFFNSEWVLNLKYTFSKKEFLDKLQIGVLIMKKEVYSNIKDIDNLESYFYV